MFFHTYEAKPVFFFIIFLSVTKSQSNSNERNMIYCGIYKIGGNNNKMRSNCNYLSKVLCLVCVPNLT